MPDFTKRHYETVALVLRGTQPEAEARYAHAQWERDCLAFVNRFRSDNPHFDADRFMLACQSDPLANRRRK